jgi:hypothetical protein
VPLPAYLAGGTVTTNGSASVYVANDDEYIMDPIHGGASKAVDGGDNGGGIYEWSDGRGPITTYMSLALIGD